MRAEDVLKALKKRYDSKEWAFFEELRAGTGYRKFDYKTGKVKPFNPEQRFDAWVINLYPSKNFERVVFEIKVSRSDFLHEIQNPEKREQALHLSNYFYFATPKGLVSKDEIPNECGLIEISEDLTSKIIKKAPFRESEHLSWQFLGAIARRACQAEGRAEFLEAELVKLKELSGDE